LLSLISAPLILILLVVGFVVYNLNIKYSNEVKGVSAKANINVKNSPIPTLSSEPEDDEVEDESSTVAIPTLNKQVGGWYLNPDTDEVEKWMGADSEGEDIWGDSDNSSEGEDGSDESIGEDSDDENDDSGNESSDENDDESEDEDSDEDNEISGGPNVTVSGNSVGSTNDINSGSSNPSSSNPLVGGTITVNVSE